MKKEGFRNLFGFTDAKINTVMIISLVLIFVLSLVYVEAMQVTLQGPVNFTYISSKNHSTFKSSANDRIVNYTRNINFTFSSNWSLGGADPRLHENVSNCSLWINSTDNALRWDIAKNGSVFSVDDNFTNSSKSLSYMNFTFTNDGNYTYSIACSNATNSSDISDAGKNYTFATGNFTIFIDLSPPRLNFTATLADVFNKSNTSHPFVTRVAQNRAVNFMVNDTKHDFFAFGVDMDLNMSINLSIYQGGSKLHVYSFKNTSDTNLSCSATAGNKTRQSTNCNITYPFTSNGTYIINISAVDAGDFFGAVANYNETVMRIIVDQIPPNISYINASQSPDIASAGAHFNNFSQGGSMFFIANVSDNLTQPGIAILQFFNETKAGSGISGWQNISTDQVNDSTDSFHANFTYAIPVGHNEFEGKNVTFRIVINDTLGNTNDSESLMNYTTKQINDTTVPAVSISSASNSTLKINLTNISNTRPLINWNINETSTLLSINVSIDHNTSTGGIGVDPSCSKFAFFDTSTGPNNVERNRNGSFQVIDDSECTLKNGTHNVTIRVVDSWNNVEVIFHTFTVQTGVVPALFFNNVTMNGGLTAQTAVHNQTNNGTNVTSLMGLTFGAAGVNTIVSTLTYVSSCNTSATVTFDNASTIYPFNESDCPTTSGNRTLTITATDSAGNSNTTVFGFRLDNVAPTLTIHVPAVDGAYLTNNIVNLNVSAFDSESQIDSIGYFLDGELVLSNLSVKANASRLTPNFGVNVSFVNRSVNFTPGTHTIRFFVNDTLGNVRNSSAFTFRQTGPLNFNVTSRHIADNISKNLLEIGFNVTISATSDPLSAPYKVVGQTNETSTIFYKVDIAVNVNSTSSSNVTIFDLNGTLANWDRASLLVPRLNVTGDVNNITRNWSNAVLYTVRFNNSLEEFVASNDSYYGRVTVPFIKNVTNASRSTAQEFWWFSDETNFLSRVNVTQCTGGFDRTTSTLCWNYTNTSQQAVHIFVPHFSVIAVVNDTTRPLLNVTTPSGNSTGNQTVSMFIPNISVTADTVSCSYMINGSSANQTMTLDTSKNICVGQTERLLNSPTGTTYQINFSIIDSSGNSYTYYTWDFSMNDTTVPGEEVVTSSPSTTSATISVTGVNESVNVTIAYSTTNTSLTLFASETDFNSSQSVSLTSLTAGQTYYFNVTICDFNGNCKTNETLFRFTTTAAASTTTSSSSSSSSGGGGAVPVTNADASASRSWDSLASGSSAVLAVNNAKIAVTSVSVDVKNAVTKAELKVESLKSNPLPTAASSKVYQYLQLTRSNIADSDTSKIIVDFKVPKSWLTANGVSEGNVALYRYAGGKWNELPTSKTGDDANNVIYQATTPGFSTFAIGSKETATAGEVPAEELPAVTEVCDDGVDNDGDGLLDLDDADCQIVPPPAEGVPEEGAGEQVTEGGAEELKTSTITWVLVGVLVIILLVGIVLWKKHHSQP